MSYTQSPNYQGAAPSTEYLGRTDRDAPPDTRMVSLLLRMEGILKSLHNQTDRCCTNADRLVGAQPSAGQKNGPAVVPSGTLGQMEAHVEQMENTIRSLADQIERFNSI